MIPHCDHAGPSQRFMPLERRSIDGLSRIQPYRRPQAPHRSFAFLPRVPKDHLSIGSPKGLDGRRAQSLRCFQLAKSYASRSRHTLEHAREGRGGDTSERIVGASGYRIGRYQRSNTCEKGLFSPKLRGQRIDAASETFAMIVTVTGPLSKV